MKKIFTFILLAISTLAMAQAYPGDPGRVAAAGTDQITFAEVAVSGADDGFFLVEDLVKPSGATYTVYAADNGTNLKFTDGESDIVTTTSGGRIQSVTVNWAASGNTTKSKILIYGKNDAYDNTGEEWDDMGTLIGTITYPFTTANNLDTHKCSYIMIAGETEPKINDISFDWMAVNTYSINVTTPPYGSIAVDATTAEPGDKINVTFTGGKSGRNTYELHSYTIDGKTTNLLPKDYTQNAYKVSFTMPAHDVTISAVFDKAVSRTTNSVTLDSHAQLHGDTITLVSGSTYTFGFTADYAITGLGTHAPYQGNVALSVDNSNLSTLKTPTYSNVTGKGSFKLAAYNQGKTKLTFTTEQDNDYNATSIEYTIIVVPREAMLITEYNGKYFGVVNNLNVAGKLAAQEVHMIDGVAYVYSDGTYTKDQMTWKICTKKDGTYTIQNSAKNYLGYSPSNPATITLTSDVYNWYKYSDFGQDRFYNNGNEIVYYNINGGLFANYAYDKCLDNNAYSHGAYEINDFATATAQTIRTDLTPDAFSTVCLPYSFIAEDDLSIYNIDNYEDKGSSYKFYFCRLDTGDLTNAGQPYIIKSPKATAKVYQIGDENASAGSYHGLHGTMSNLAWSSVWGTGNYTLGNVLVINGSGEIKYANGNGGVFANRAYMLLDEIPTESDCTDSPSGAPRRVMLSTEAQHTPTAVDQLQSADAINWNEPVYNVMGQRVARGTTGVLVQNGQKFIAL